MELANGRFGFRTFSLPLLSCDRPFLENIEEGSVIVLCAKGGVLSNVKLAAWKGQRVNLKFSALMGFEETDRALIFPPGSTCVPDKIKDKVDDTMSPEESQLVADHVNDVLKWYAYWKDRNAGVFWGFQPSGR